jgi:hypothetical protein
VWQCLPDYGVEGYPPCDDAALDAIAAHLDAAVALVDQVDPNGARLLRSTIRTLHVGLRRDPLCSFSSANDLPGSSIVVLSLERLADGDVAATAAQLLHEVGHVLLGLYLLGARPGLPDAMLYVSPYKNDLQTLEGIIHMGYTIPWECAVRMACLPSIRDPERLDRAKAFIIAYAARQAPIQAILAKELTRLELRRLGPVSDIAAIPGWANAVLELVERLLAAEPKDRRVQHLDERILVWRRQADDIGQILLRGGRVIDPGLNDQGERAGEHEIAFVYQGEKRHAVRHRFAATGKNYGGYVAGPVTKASGRRT